MNTANAKEAGDAVKTIGPALKYINDFVDNVADDFSEGRWARGSVKTLLGLAVVGGLAYCVVNHTKVS